MPEKDEWRHEIDHYPHRTVIQTRFQDVDMLGHINNVAFAALFETARVRFNHQLGMTDWREHRWLIARLEIDYLAEAYHPADIEIATGVGAIGNRSWRLLSVAYQDGKPVARCEAVLVMEAKAGVASLPADFRQSLERFRLP